MFEKLAKTPSRKRSATKVELPQTTAFLACVVEHGFRLSYGALAQAARTLGEDGSTQILAQRGASLVKSLPEALQPHVCRKAGGYKKGVLKQFTTELPEDLEDRPVITADSVETAVDEYLASLE